MSYSDAEAYYLQAAPTSVKQNYKNTLNKAVLNALYANYIKQLEIAKITKEVENWERIKSRKW